jgi:hypothetical protein
MTGPKQKVVDGDIVELDQFEQERIKNRWEQNASTLSDAKQMKIKQIKRIARSVLRKTDWYCIRNQETGEPVPQAVSDHRSNIRSQSEIFESEVKALNSVAAVQSYSFTYPDPPVP